MPDEVISDTSPLQYLHQADCLDLLPALYGSVIISEGVAEELAVGRAQGVSLPDLRALDWIEIRPAPHLGILPLAVNLGQGEREVLSLAAERSDALALLDDGLARHFARHLGIRFTGTLGVLPKAKIAGRLDAVRPVLDRLQALGFWLDSATREGVLEIASESGRNDP